MSGQNSYLSDNLLRAMTIILSECCNDIFSHSVFMKWCAYPAAYESRILGSDVNILLHTNHEYYEVMCISCCIRITNIMKWCAYPAAYESRILWTINFTISSQNTAKFVHFILSQLLPVVNTGTAGDKASFEKLEEALNILDNTLNGQTWVAGNNITIADYSIVVTVSCIEVSLL